MDTEHIYIGDEFADPQSEPVTVTDERQIRNRVDGSRTSLTFYEEGFLRVRQSRKGEAEREHVLELRFVKPEPAIVRHTAFAFLWSALGFGVLAYLAPFLLALAGLSGFAWSASIALSVIATLSLMMFVYRSRAKYEFRTTIGQAVVLSLSASFGCMRKVKAIAGSISNAVAHARSGTSASDESYLRAEMKAHYRLVEMGVISREACSLSTTQILSRFG